MRALCVLAVFMLATNANAICTNNEPPRLSLAVLDQYKKKDRETQTNKRFESAAISKTIPGVCYSPFHNTEYPMGGVGSPAGLDLALKNDFNIMKNYYSVVRTYYSNFYGYSVAKPASEVGVQLFLGVYMTTDDWWYSQYTEAVQAVKDYPSTISAILVGNENVPPVGPFSTSEVSTKISMMRTMVVAGTGRSVPIGTVQRAADWLDQSRRAEMLALANNCDIIGVNIYPFFDSNYDPSYPLVILNGVWDQMVAVFGSSKLRLTEVGFPTGGPAPANAKQNVPSMPNSQRFYNAFVNWNPSSGGGESFWFMFFDRKPNDNTVTIELEKYFGFYTYDKRAKAVDYPVLLSALTQAGAPAATPPLAVAATVAPAATPAPTTRTPTPSTPATPVPTTAAPTRTTPPPPATTAPTQAPITSIVLPPVSNPANVCRVRKLFF